MGPDTRLERVPFPATWRERVSYRDPGTKYAEASGELRVIYDTRLVGLQMAQTTFTTGFGQGILCDCVTCSRSIWMRPEADLGVSGDLVPDSEVHRVFAKHGWTVKGFEERTQCPRCVDEGR